MCKLMLLYNCEILACVLWTGCGNRTFHHKLDRNDMWHLLIYNFFFLNFLLSDVKFPAPVPLETVVEWVLWYSSMWAAMTCGDWKMSLQTGHLRILCRKWVSKCFLICDGCRRVQGPAGDSSQGWVLCWIEKTRVWLVLMCFFSARCDSNE